VTSCL